MTTQLKEEENGKSTEIVSADESISVALDFDDDNDWVTSMTLHDDTQESFVSNFNLFHANKSLLKSLSGKPIRTVNQNNLDIDCDLDNDETLMMECVGECKCCNKCPLCKNYLETTTLTTRKDFRDVSTQMNSYIWMRHSMKKIRNEQRYSKSTYGKGDDKNRAEKSQRESSFCSNICVDKPKLRQKYVRPLVELYPEYIKYMIRKQWSEIDHTFKQNFRKSSSSSSTLPSLSTEEVKKCRKRIGYQFSAEQLENMYNISLKQMNRVKDVNERSSAKKSNRWSDNIVTKKDTSQNQKFAVKMTKATVLRAQAVKEKHPWLK